MVIPLDKFEPFCIRESFYQRRQSWAQGTDAVYCSSEFEMSGDGIVYWVHPELVIEGRAIAINLCNTSIAVGDHFEKCPLPSILSNLHATLLWRRSGFTNDDLDSVISCMNDWLDGRSIIKFSLQPFGPRSDKITGELYDMSVVIRSEFALWDEKPRAFHVELRK
jgi:hypothetical protein